MSSTTSVTTMPKDGLVLSDSEEHSEIRVLLEHGASHKGYYRMEDNQDLTDVAAALEAARSPQPPLPLRRAIDEKTWKRFKGYMTAVCMTPAHVGKSGIFAFCIWPFWVVFLIVMNVKNWDVRYDGVYYAFIASTIIMLGAFALSRWVEEPRYKEQGYTRVLNKMQRTFNDKGYLVELGSMYETCAMRRRFYIVFTRDPSVPLHLQETAQVNQDKNSEEEDYGPYQPADWYPLEGTWVRVDNIGSSSFGLLAFLRCIFKTSSLVWTISGVSSPETFKWDRVAQGRWLGCIPKKVVSMSRLVAKHAKNKDGSSVEYLNAAEYVPRKPLSPSSTRCYAIAPSSQPKSRQCKHSLFLTWKSEYLAC